MLHMVIERFKNGSIAAVGERFRAKGRMMPENVSYVASWLDPAGTICYQLMEAPDAAALQPWFDRWNDLMDFEVKQVLSSADFWAQFLAKQGGKV